MAMMIPDEVQSFTTEGEGKFYHFLSEKKLFKKESQETN